MCDEMGFLVWQVFPLHYCVSDDDDLIERASEMIRDMGLMLCNHACIGMWSVFKEPEVYLLPDVPNNYHRLCPILKQTLGTVDPSRWIHLGDYREGALNLMIGYCWPGDTDLHEVELPPQIVEFGAGSIPVRETLETFVPADALWPPDWDTWEYHGFFYNLAFGFAKVQMTETLDELHRRLPAVRGAGGEGAGRVPASAQVPPRRLDVPLLLERSVSDHGIGPARLLPPPLPGVRGDAGRLRTGPGEPGT